MKISLAMIVKNEEKNIARCLQSVKDLVDEIVIVDTGSTDNTINIIREHQNVNLYHYEWCDDFSSARNYSIEKTTGDYILVLDADEYIISGTRNDLDLIMSQNAIGRILVYSDFKKENQDLCSKNYISRFFPKDVQFTGIIHEQLNSKLPRVKMNLKVKHSGYYNTKKGERNIPLLIKAVQRNPLDPYYLFQLGRELRISEKYLESFNFLIRSYKLINQNESYYGELVVELINCGKECGKEEVLEVIKQNENLLNNVSDFHFAKGLYFLNYCFQFPTKAQLYIQNIESSFLTCLLLNDKVHVEYLEGTSTFLPAYNLGVYYEVNGERNKALEFYKLSSHYGYRLADKRIKELCS
ncbi:MULTISPECIES: glycosyltransferase family 2 protein [Bacillaceae]|uniref:glycosyltransferase family 2 protein n=1 Tax=Metabacillus sp. 22489 TaxID=3453928 RepID=UPI000BA7422A|nr:hypothetical protein CHH83_08060 [Bacillus sp. 7586-K]